MGKGGEPHKALIEQGRAILKKEGFRDCQIREEYVVMPSGDRTFLRCVVDIVGLSEDKKVAIECGGLNSGASWRFSRLRLLFDKVIWLPYVHTDIKEYGECKVLTETQMIEEMDEQMHNDPIHQYYEDVISRQNVKDCCEKEEEQ